MLGWPLIWQPSVTPEVCNSTRPETGIWRLWAQLQHSPRPTAGQDALFKLKRCYWDGFSFT